MRRVIWSAISFAALGIVGVATPAFASCDSTAPEHPAAHVRVSADALQNMLTQADQALQRADYGDACTKYRMVLSVDNRNVAARLGLGEGALAEGDYSAARVHFHAVVTADSTNVRALQGEGLAALMSGDLAGAETLLHQSASADATLWRSWNALGVIADSRADWTAADAAWTAAIAAAPNQADIYNNKGMSLMQRGDAAGARGAFDQALRLNPALKTAASNRRVALAMLGQYDAALAGVSAEDLPAALNNVAVVAARRGDRAVADRLLAAAITNSPEYYELAVRNRETVAQRGGHS